MFKPRWYSFRVSRSFGRTPPRGGPTSPSWGARTARGGEGYPVFTRRVPNWNASGRSSSTSESKFLSPLPRSNFLSLFEDRRLWHPQGIWSPARAFSRSRHRLELFPRMNSVVSGIPFLQPERVAFSNPSKVLICVRRKVRKEVMHALKKAGGRGQAPPHYSEYSSVVCQ